MNIGPTFAECMEWREILFKLTLSFATQYTDAKLAELVDCLLAHPDIVTLVELNDHYLTDKTGIKLAKYLSASSTVAFLDLSYNHLGSETYLAVAAALRVNSSLRLLYLFGNQKVDRTCIDTVFIDALRINPVRPVISNWRLYVNGWVDIDFKRLKDAAEKSTPPSMLEFLLCVH
jgi:hypothetical protein